MLHVATGWAQPHCHGGECPTNANLFSVGQVSNILTSFLSACCTGYRERAVEIPTCTRGQLGLLQATVCPAPQRVIRRLDRGLLPAIPVSVLSESAPKTTQCNRSPSLRHLPEDRTLPWKLLSMELQAEAVSRSCLAIPSLCKWGLAKDQREGRGWLTHLPPPRLQGMIKLVGKNTSWLQSYCGPFPPI